MDVNDLPSPAGLLDIAEQTLSRSAVHHHLRAKEEHHKTPWPGKAEAL